MTADQERYLRIARALVDNGLPLNEVFGNGIIPSEHREFVRSELTRDDAIVLVPARTIVSNQSRPDWLASLDRSSWYYWPELRQFLLSKKGLQSPVVRSIDNSTDRILRELAHPSTEQFDIRGLVLGYVQSGKTGNFSALIAKAADAGYRLIVVLSGIDNGLRRQTNARLQKELVGYSPARLDSVPLPPVGKQWHEFTRPEFDGDFRAGHANPAALQGSQPVLVVAKKNAAVLRRFIEWLKQASPSVLRALPVLVIDDEADQASIDTQGSAPSEQDSDEPYEPPSVINGLIRNLLVLFEKRAYVAYTATPFANILVPHDVDDPSVGNDLYPKDFIIDLPKQDGYFGAERIFGRFDDESKEPISGLDVVREISDEDMVALDEDDLPKSLSDAILDFVLAGAARAERGRPEAPAAMLVHTSPRIADHRRFAGRIADAFDQLRDMWRYQRNKGIRATLETRWNDEQRVTTRRIDASRERAFDAIEPHIGPFFEKVDVRAVNSETKEPLDYDREPELKAIVVGGNRLSRGLTIEGLLVSYFARRSPTYDTLMQMGRWFGYRTGYEDLTRIWTTRELSQWFSDLALVEHRLREDIAIYEDLGYTPAQVGLRIWKHPAMQVTSLLKQRHSGTTTIRQSFDLSLEQTFKFPFRSPERLAALAARNLTAVRGLTEALGEPVSTDDGLTWHQVGASDVLRFLGDYQLDDAVRSFSMPLVRRYIEECVADGELKKWIVSIRARKKADNVLGTVDWGPNARLVRQIARTRLSRTESLGVITGQGDEAVGLSPGERSAAEELVAKSNAAGRKKALNTAAREVRDPSTGLLLLYPISRFSGLSGGELGAREPLFADPQGPHACDLVGLALSFPRSEKPRSIEAYVTGTVAAWEPSEN